MNRHTKSHDPGRPKPRGVGLLTLFNAALALYVLAQTLPGLQDPPPEHWPRSAVAAAPYLSALCVLVIAAAGWTWRGSRHGRTLLLLALTVWTGVLFFDDALRIKFFITEYYAPAPWRHGGFWGALVLYMRWAVWLAINLWYFLGARSRLFFEAQG